jgi:hypothetical protein
MATLFVGLFAGWVTTRNARKTPHENLKALTEIRTALANDPAAAFALDEAIAFEIERLEEITLARGQGRIRYWWTRVRQVDSFIPLAAIAAGVVVTIASVSRILQDDSNAQQDQGLSPVLSLSLAAVSVAVSALLAITLRQRRIDRGIDDAVHEERLYHARLIAELRQRVAIAEQRRQSEDD